MSVNQGQFISEVFERFLQENPVGEAGQANYLYTMREVIQPIEDESGIPFCEIPLEELKKKIAAIPLGMTSTFRKTLSYLNRYREWYMNRFMGVFRLSNNERIRIEDLDLSAIFRASYYCTIDEAIDAAEKYYPVLSGYLDSVLAALYWLGYSYEEILTLRNDQVSIEGSVALIQSKIIREKKIVSVLDSYQKNDVFMRSGLSYSKAFGAEFLRRIGRFDGERQNRPVNQRFLVDYLISHSKDYEKAFSFLPLHKMGKLDRLWILSQSRDVQREDVIHEFGALSRIAMLDVLHDIECYFKLRKEMAAK